MELCYKVKAIGNPMPFYYYPSKKASSWIYNSDFRLVDPPDGFYADPPAPTYVDVRERGVKGQRPRTRSSSTHSTASKENNNTSSKTSDRVNSKIVKTIQNLDNDENEEFNYMLYSYLEGNDKIPLSFMKMPYFPSDIFVLFDGPTIKKNLTDLMKLKNWSVSKSSTKQNNTKLNNRPGSPKSEKSEEKFEKKKEVPIKKGISIEDIINPANKTLHGTILNDTPNNLSSHIVNLTKTCRSFITQSDYTRIVDIIKRIETHPDVLSDLAVFMMSQTNSKQANQSIKNAWELFTIIISRFKIENDFLNKILRSYFAIVASSVKSTNEIRNFAMICLFRLSCENTPIIKYDPTAPLLFFSDCCSPKHLFGVSLGEVLYKERVLNESAKSPTLVPFIIRKLVTKLILSGAFKTREIFNQKSISHTEKVATIQRLNKGDWEIDVANIHTVAAILKHFLKNLQEPLLPNSMVDKLDPEMEGYKCVQLANTLPNENMDTLMYIVGFLQELSTHERETLMNTKRLAAAVAPSLARKPPIDQFKSDDLLQYQRSLERFLLCLINDWNTEEVYNADA
ncbi:hypothetical protein TRFO_35340 [Tritrichomonas foetus]|uniref:Rho-GAP domain-containing protein n=1 Tax=Tritrichomonas foetus TaxID=1144522 RepID=A0A1J4JL30_9EUKA|nr:hypothetical protein TRFO_35340 [Tritrichomonas foetus]|eukprot:OHS98275.1 hypothetical protein TRFO_35340 [Tritrichomonas foetus]